MGDLDGDGDLDVLTAGRESSVVLLNGVVVGDVNRDELFNRNDLAEALAEGKYMTGLQASWEQGDWNGDEVFDQYDLVFALQMSVV